MNLSLSENKDSFLEKNNKYIRTRKEIFYNIFYFDREVSMKSYENDKRLKNKEWIWKLTNSLHDSKNLNEVFENAINQILIATNAEAGTLWVLDEEEKYIHPLLVRGPSVGKLKGMKLKNGEGLAGWVVKNRISQIISDVSNDERWAKRFDKSTSYITKSIICVPLDNRNSCIGCLQLLNKKDGSLFNKDDLELCEELAAFIAVAIDERGLMLKREDHKKDTLIELDKVNKEYKMGDMNIKVLNNVSLEIYNRELVVILGPSGSGKSTLLNIIGGMDKATSGKILVNNQDLVKSNDRELMLYRRHEVGFIFQLYNLIPDLTASENISLAAKMAKQPYTVEEVLEKVDLTKRRNNFPSQMSGGEQQRVSIARAIVKKPKLLLCDEPTGALDYKTGKKILKLIEQISRIFMGTVVIVTHNSAFGAMADRVIKMKSGEIIEIVTNPHPVPSERIEW